MPERELQIGRELIVGFGRRQDIGVSSVKLQVSGTGSVAPFEPLIGSTALLFSIAISLSTVAVSIVAFDLLVRSLVATFGNDVDHPKVSLAPVRAFGVMLKRHCFACLA